MKILGKGFALKDEKTVKLRRADNFVKMAVAAATRSCSDLDLSNGDNNISIILATQFGPHVTTFKFLDNLLDFSPAGVSPTVFSHSVHNAAASYIASSLGILGQALTITSFTDPLKQALVIGRAWLELGQADKLVICYVEEESEPFSFSFDHCSFPSYSKNGFTTGAAAILVKKGNDFQIPLKILNPFTFIKEL